MQLSRSSLQKLNFVLALCLIVLCRSGVAEATTFFVSTMGSDTNPGTQLMPFRTIKKGTSVLKSGDTLLVEGGTYEECIFNSIPGSSSWTTPTIVKGYPGQTVTLKPRSGEFVLFVNNADKCYIDIENLSLDATNVAYDAVKITSGSSTEAGAHHIRIKNCVVKNSMSNGIFITTVSHNNEMINLDVNHSGRSGAGHGFYIQGQDNLVEGCLVHDNAKIGIQVFNGYSPVAHRNIIRNNKVYDNATLNVSSGQSGITINSGNDSLVYNNLVWGQGIGIAAGYNVSGARIYNNTIYGNRQGGVIIGSGSTGAVIRNNIVYLSGGGIINYANSSILSNNLVNIDPKFVNPTAHDFHLQSGSPAIGAGMNLSTKFSDDFDGTLRQATGPWDIGAYRH